MAANKLDLARREPRGQGVVSQATHVEQSRAIAQVQGALVVAQERPRDAMRAFNRMQEACALEALAERAFFSFERAKQQIAGPSIHLATELARCWGNVDYGIVELSRGEDQSEMLAYAWDLETNTRITNSFLAPHIRDTRYGPKVLTDTRDVYENNANLGARRLRECIFRVLPVSFREEAETLCRQTLEHGGGEPIEKRRAKLLEAFAGLGISRRRVERRTGRSADHLTAFDIGHLRVVFQTLKRGETTAEAEFPDDSGEEAAAELRKQAPKEAPKTAPPAAQEGPKDEPEALPLDGGNGPRGWRVAYPDGTFGQLWHDSLPAADELMAWAKKAPAADVKVSIGLNEALVNAREPQFAQALVRLHMGKRDAG